MQQSGQNGDPISSKRQVTSRSMGARRVESGAAVALAALLGIVAASVGCEGSDTTDFPAQGGSSGSGAGRSGAGGATAGASGSGGRAGASGAGGSTAGTGGAGGSAGTGGTGGTGAGTGGTAEVPDGGVDGGDAAAPPVLSQREISGQAICATGDSLDGCDSSPTCLEGHLEFFTLYLGDFPDCWDEADAYFDCQATQPVTSYECAGSPPAPQFVAGNPACADQEAAFYVMVADPPSCE